MQSFLIYFFKDGPAGSILEILRHLLIVLNGLTDSYFLKWSSYALLYFHNLLFKPICSMLLTPNQLLKLWPPFPTLCWTSALVIPFQRATSPNAFTVSHPFTTTCIPTITTISNNKTTIYDYITNAELRYREKDHQDFITF